MTENEAIKEIKRWTEILLSAGSRCTMETAEAQDMSIKALEEVQQYRQIGTVEECRMAMKKHQPVIPHRIYKGRIDMWCDCGNWLGRKTDTDRCKYCSLCGRKIDWGDDDGTD